MSHAFIVQQRESTMMRAHLYVSQLKLHPHPTVATLARVWRDGGNGSHLALGNIFG